MSAPVVRGTHDDAVDEGLLPGGCEKTVDVALLQTVILGIQLALDRVGFACAVRPCDQVDPGVALVESLRLSPITVGPDVAVEVTVSRLVAQIAEH